MLNVLSIFSILSLFLIIYLYSEYGVVILLNKNFLKSISSAELEILSGLLILNFLKDFIW